MHSKNRSYDQVPASHSFIEEARRRQIIAAAITTLAEIGYGKASLSQIAKRANISTSLISYHFKDKDELMRQVLLDISARCNRYMHEKIEAAPTVTQKLRAYIESNLGYMGTRPELFIALVEVLFSARSDDGKLLYRMQDDESGRNELQRLLEEGQQKGEFYDFNTYDMAICIRGAIDQFLGQMVAIPRFNLESYMKTVVAVFEKVIIKEYHDKK